MSTIYTRLFSSQLCLRSLRKDNILISLSCEFYADDQVIMILNSSSSSSLWEEEKAFAEDIGKVNGIEGSFGGCVWPPRSYSCAFCLREFRSAQALGGHMNIHRRDRARLKQKGLIAGNNDSSRASSHHHVISYSQYYFSVADNYEYYDRSTRALTDLWTDNKAIGSESKRPELLCLFKPLQSAAENIIHDKVTTVASMDDLDLELRLGHAK